MTEAEWLACSDPGSMLGFLRRTNKASNRQLRLFVCALARHLWHMLTVPRSRRAVEAAERFADRLIRKREMTAAGASAQDAAWEVSVTGPRRKDRPTENAFLTARYAAYADAWNGAIFGSRHALHVEGAAPPQGAILRDVFGPLPFRSIKPDPAWLAWNDGTVRKLAQAIYDERRFGDLPVLADALEEAGCDNADILAHCRQPGEHVRGCWVVDLLLAKE